MYDIPDRTIGRYQINRHLAHGGMADIYLAHDPECQQVVALKLVHKSNYEYCQRFHREIQEMASLQHAHILPVLDYGEDRSWCYLVMPYITDGTLATLLAQGPLPLERAGQILAQLSSALQYSHERGILHRDIKPSNILIGAEDHVYLADFGLVKHVGEINGLTQSGYLIGTPDYMAPELALEQATIHSDIYALGVLFYQMVTGRLPFLATTPIAAFMKHISDEPTLPSLLNPAIPLTVETIVLRALDKDPLQRFHSPCELSHAYQQALAIASAQQLREDTVQILMSASADTSSLLSEVQQPVDVLSIKAFMGKSTKIPVVHTHGSVRTIHTRGWLATFFHHPEIFALVATTCVLVLAGAFYAFSQTNLHYAAVQSIHATTSPHRSVVSSKPTVTSISITPTVITSSPTLVPTTAVSQPAQSVPVQNVANNNANNNSNTGSVKNGDGNGNAKGKKKNK